MLGPPLDAYPIALARHQDRLRAAQQRRRARNLTPEGPARKGVCRPLPHVPAGSRSWLG